MQIPIEKKNKTLSKVCYLKDAANYNMHALLTNNDL